MSFDEESGSVAALCRSRNLLRPEPKSDHFPLVTDVVDPYYTLLEGFPPAAEITRLLLILFHSRSLHLSTCTVSCSYRVGPCDDTVFYLLSVLCIEKV